MFEVVGCLLSLVFFLLSPRYNVLSPFTRFHSNGQCVVYTKSCSRELRVVDKRFVQGQDVPAVAASVHPFASAS